VVTDHKFTGQKLDATGLQYYQSRYYDPAIGTFISPDTVIPDATSVFGYNRLQYYQSRYYDPAIGTFISPDTVIPDATSVFGYNRYMYGFGNPLKFSDPTGHDPQCDVGTSACDTEWGLWRQYQQTEDAWSSWDDFKQGYSNYAQYMANPDSYVQDWLVRAQMATGDWDATVDRLALAETYSTSVLGEPVPAFFDDDTPRNVLYQLAEQGKSIGDSGVVILTMGVGAFTPPQLPPRIIVQQNGVTIQHYYRGGDHGPPHLHVSGEGENTRIGQNGYPIDGSPELTSAQRNVVMANRSTIRGAVDRIMRWYRYQTYLNE